MLILHISDIHFKSPDCLNPFTDPDVAIRSRMMRDLGEQRKTLGPVGAILIGGDIAYKADPAEYVTALNWIYQLCEISGCSKERVFLVPGNHDVDRGVIKNDLLIQNAQHAVATTAFGQRGAKLFQQLSHETIGQDMLKAHSAYNDFAAPFGCQIWPEKPFWHQEFPFEGGVKLRFYGLTSTLMSGQNGDDDKERELFLGHFQTVLDPVPNTINFVLVHHPLGWLADGDEVDDILATRASFHLFGHKHKQRAVMEANYVRLGAGAVNPSRHEKPYDPGYNLIKLRVEGTGPDRKVKVELHQRRLQDVPELFIAIQTPQGGNVFTSTISIPEEAEFPEIDGVQEKLAIAAKQGVHHDDGETIVVEDPEAAMGEEHRRDLLYRFWSLTSSQRREIVQKLGLLEEGEIKLPEPERYGRALIRAGQREQMDEVAVEVARLEN